MSLGHPVGIGYFFELCDCALRLNLLQSLPVWRRGTLSQLVPVYQMSMFLVSLLPNVV